jgi:hypothetical protein
MLNSGCAGHTYGANGLWQVNLPDKRFGKSPGGNDWGGTPWRVAMDLPGSTQLGTARKFLLTLPWHQLAPAVDLAPGAVSAAISADRRLALVYTTAAKPLTVHTSQLPGAVTARWYDPANGQLQDAGRPGGGAHTFTPPSRNAAGDPDWLLVLQSR